MADLQEGINMMNGNGMGMMKGDRTGVSDNGNMPSMSIEGRMNMMQMIMEHLAEEPNENDD